MSGHKGAQDDGFLARWSRRKTETRQGQAPADAPPSPPSPLSPSPPHPGADAAAVPAPHAPALAEAPGGDATQARPAPTLEDVARLGRDSDYSRFVAGGVDEGVKRAALKKLFSDPHFNVMDGLDVYIDDYGAPDPLPPALLRQLRQSQVLGLFEAEEASAAAEAAATTETAAPSDTPPPAPAAPLTDSTALRDDDPDLRLQQDDEPGRPGAEPGPGP